MAIDTKKLEACSLWAGSMLQQDHKHDLLDVDKLCKRRDIYAGCKDMTPAEKEFNKAIIETIDEERRKLLP